MDRAPAPAASPAVAGPASPVAASDKAVKEKAPPRAAAVAPRKPTGESRSADRPQQPAADAQVPIRVSRGGRQVNPDLAAGYRQFQADDLSGARRSYEQALRSDPRSVDALNGLAAVAAREGRGAEAQQYYLRALEADPQDATAQSALALMGESGDPVQTESRLTLLLARQPDAHAACFALGNLYASQRQWREAQQAYFDADAADPENPDYLFNLAVSLDQLSQPRLALEFYRKALADGATSDVTVPATKFETDAACRVYLGQVETGVGITLNAANYMIYFSLPWKLLAYDQSIDRNHRVGQRRDVTVFRLLCRHTIDIHIARGLSMKRTVSETIISALTCAHCDRRERCAEMGITLFEEGGRYNATYSVTLREQSRSNMPKITITYTHEELVAFVTGMLAVQGLHPVTDIQFVSLDTDLNRFNLVIDCEPGPLSKKCPPCGVKLTNGVPVPVAIVAVPREAAGAPLHSTEKTAAAPLIQR